VPHTADRLEPAFGGMIIASFGHPGMPNKRVPLDSYPRLKACVRPSELRCKGTSSVERMWKEGQNDVTQDGCATQVL